MIQTAPRYKPESAFTIVELLIVIVVIAILAAITIVAYNGIQDRARASAASQALANTAKKIKYWQAEQDTTGFPTSLAVIRVTDSGSVSYQYTQDLNGTYCVTATVNGKSYKLTGSAASQSVLGACPGHAVDGGTVISNLVANPSLEADMTSWTVNWGTGGAGTTSRRTDGGVSGSSYIRATWTAASTSANGGVYYNHPASGSITEGVSYTGSVSVRPSRSQRMKLSLYWINSSGGAVTTIDGQQTVINSGSWTRLSVSGTAPAGAVRYFLVPFATAGTGYGAWAINDYVDADGAMLSESTTLYNYADGNTLGWAWSGNANSTTSFGPPSQ